MIPLTLGTLALALCALSAWEARRLATWRGAIPVRVHVNGTRGKSSVTRLIAAGLRAGGVRTCAKTTGTQARFIDPEGREVPVRRLGTPSVLEQVRLLGRAAAWGAQAFVVECMALQPRLQALSELEIVQSTHGVITNARPDHLEVMGPGVDDVALALAGTTPRGGRLYTAEQARVGVFAAACRDRAASLRRVGPEAVSPAELEGFPPGTHPENVALALAVCEDLGVPRATALAGMRAAPPEVSSRPDLRLTTPDGREVVFVDAFAANDPSSSLEAWRAALARHPECTAALPLVHGRRDRGPRTWALGRALGRWPRLTRALFLGGGWQLFARASVGGGLERARLRRLRARRPEALWSELAAELAELEGDPQRVLVVGVGNTKELGLELADWLASQAEAP